MEERIFLGLDVSTTTIGVSLVSYNGVDYPPKLLKVTHISPKAPKNLEQIETLLIKKDIFKEEFIKKYKDIGITDVIIEEPLMGSNNINTTSMLLKFSALITNVIYEELNIIPKYISSYDSRAYAFPELMQVRRFNKKGEEYPENKIKKSKPVLFGDYPWDIDKKQVIFDKVSELYPDIEWIYNRLGRLAKENFDSSDAICCVLGFINKENQNK